MKELTKLFELIILTSLGGSSEEIGGHLSIWPTKSPEFYEYGRFFSGFAKLFKKNHLKNANFCKGGHYPVCQADYSDMTTLPTVGVFEPRPPWPSPHLQLPHLGAPDLRTFNYDTLKGSPCHLASWQPSWRKDMIAKPKFIKVGWYKLPGKV